MIDYNHAQSCDIENSSEMHYFGYLDKTFSFASNMEKGQSFDMLIRPERISNSEILYRVFAFWKDATADELLLHQQIIEIIEGCEVRVKSIDKFRFEIYVRKEISVQSD